MLRPQVGTIRPGTFKYAPTGRKAKIEEIHEEVSFPISEIRTRFLGFTADSFDPELDIANCETIVCVGAGMKNESLPKYRELAALLGGKIACTRPIVDRELLPHLQLLRLRHSRGHGRGLRRDDPPAQEINMDPG